MARKVAEEAAKPKPAIVAMVSEKMAEAVRANPESVRQMRLLTRPSSLTDPDAQKRSMSLRSIARAALRWRCATT